MRILCSHSGVQSCTFFHLLCLPASASKPKALTSQQLQFVENYCTHWNGTKAAEEAHYPPKSARQQASNLLADERVQAAIVKRMERYSMSAAEAQAKLAEWGRGTVAHFLKANEDGAIVVNLAHPAAQEHLHLLKKVKQRRRIARTDTAEFEEITAEFEIHDPKDAVDKTLRLLGKYAPQKVDLTTLGQVLPGTQLYLPDNGRD